MPPTQSLPAQVRTARLTLRRQDAADAPLIKDAIDTSLTHLQSAVAWAQAAPILLSVLAARLAASAAAFNAGLSRAFSIFDLAQSRVLGGAGLERVEAALIPIVGPNAIETGYWLRADATGHGYATEATACLIGLAFKELGAQRIVVCHGSPGRGRLASSSHEGLGAR